MIRINDFFQLERKKHSWNLYHNIPKRTQDGRLVYRKRTTYYSDIYDSMQGVIHHSLNGSLSAYLAPQYTQRNYPDQNHFDKQTGESSNKHLSSNHQSDVEQSNDKQSDDKQSDDNKINSKEKSDEEETDEEDHDLEDEYEEENLDQRFENHVDYQLESVEQIKEMLDNIYKDIKQSIFDHSDQVIIGQKLYNIKTKMAEDEAKAKKKK